MKLLGITWGCAAHVHWESTNPSQEACILEAQKEVSCCHHGCVKIPRYMDVYGILPWKALVVWDIYIYMYSGWSLTPYAVHRDYEITNYRNPIELTEHKIWTCCFASSESPTLYLDHPKGVLQWMISMIRGASTIHHPLGFKQNPFLRCWYISFCCSLSDFLWIFASRDQFFRCKLLVFGGVSWIWTWGATEIL